MRTIIYGVLEKATGKMVYISAYRENCINKMQNLGEGYELRYKWRSF